jgi:hypothetical protein
MPLRLCSVGFKSATGVSHSVDVEAETLYEAAALGLARLKKDGWIEGLGPGTRLEIHVREPGSHHALSVQQVQRWIDSVNASPGETLKKGEVATTPQILAARIWRNSRARGVACLLLR